MSSSQNSDKLFEQLEHLEDDWNSYKKSLARLSCHRLSVGPSSSSSMPTTPTTTTSTYIADSNCFDIVHCSPKMLVSSLTHPTTTLHPTPSGTTSPASSLTAPDEAHDKRLEIFSGRSLLDELERAKDDDFKEDGMDKEKVTSGSQCSGGGSSTVVQGVSEDDDASDSSCCSLSAGKDGVQKQIDSTDDEEDSDDSDYSDYTDDSSSSSGEEEEEVVVEGGGDGSMRRSAKMTPICFVVFAVLLPLLLSLLFTVAMSEHFPF